MARLETLQLSWLTEMEQLQVQQDDEIALLQQAFATKLIAHDDYERKLTLLEAKHAKQRQKLEQAFNESKLKMFTAGAGQILSAAAVYTMDDGRSAGTIVRATVTQTIESTNNEAQAVAVLKCSIAVIDDQNNVQTDGAGDLMSSVYVATKTLQSDAASR